jgi:2'-5' RNA ligase
MKKITGTSEWGSFALVSYLPDPLKSFLHQLRETLPGEANPEPHVTILPPRPLRLGMEAASDLAYNILSQFSAFHVELSNVCSFPETNVLYLDIVQGSEPLYQLHAALNAGDLSHSEEFEFRPHLTLAGAMPAVDLGAARRKAEAAWLSADCPRQFMLDEIVFLWLSPEDGQDEWTRLWSHSLSKKKTSARTAIASVRSQTC